MLLVRCGDRLVHWQPPWLAFGLFACPRANEYSPIPARTPDMSSRSAAVTFGASAGLSDVPMAAAPQIRMNRRCSRLASRLPAMNPLQLVTPYPAQCRRPTSPWRIGHPHFPLLLDK